MLRHLRNDGTEVGFYKDGNDYIKHEWGENREVTLSVGEVSPVDAIKYIREVSISNIGIKEAYDALQGRKTLVIEDVQTMNVHEFWSRIGV